MKKIKINFCDFWPNFNYIESDFYKILSQKYQVEISDNPEFLFYSVFGNDHLKYECIKIFYTGENVIPDFNLCDYGIGYAYLDFDDRYLRFPIFRIYGYEKFLKIALNIHKENIKKRKKFCNFIYSNNKADKEREEFYNLLSQYKKIDSGGRYLNNIGEPVKDKFLFQQQYKFSIAFENTSSKGYTTEKLIEAKAAGTIPIYWGNPEIAKEFNTKSFINCHEYENFEAVIEVVKKIDNDDELYLKYLNEPFCLEIFDLEKKGLSDFLYNIIEKKQIIRSIDKTSKEFSNYNKLRYLKEIEKKRILKKIVKFFI